ncbi:MAG: hypothetical protein HY941_03445 [Gammaproteobacteria bacterium]|nr:hypothetical protein [Gammaproteobacteria bacterium]
MLQNSTVVNATDYRAAMGQLLVLYTQVDHLIMEICAERIATAPDTAAKLALAKQTGDESRHVSIQNTWMEKFGVDATPLITAEQQAMIRAHFRDLPWLEFLADLYLCVEALGSEAVEKIVPLADPGTRESLRVPLSDELDHVAFGVTRLKQELATLPAQQRRAFVACIPDRIEALTEVFHGFDLGVPTLFTAVGADYRRLCEQLDLRQDELLDELVA